MRSLVLALALVAAPALADRTAAQWITGCGFSGTPASVVIDVYNAAAAGALLATIPNGSLTRVAGTSDCYTANLAAASGIAYPAPADPTEKHYIVRFRDDADASGVFATASVAGIVGATGEVSDACSKVTQVYASSPIGARGLTQRLINEGLPSYSRVDVACDRDFATPDATYYLHRYYDSTGRNFYELPAAAVPNP